MVHLGKTSVPRQVSKFLWSKVPTSLFRWGVCSLSPPGLGWVLCDLYPPS